MKMVKTMSLCIISIYNGEGYDRGGSSPHMAG